MEIYHTKIKPIPGTNYREVYPRAWALYKQIASKTKRRPYIRSAYFNKEKVFIDRFWTHIRQKNMRDRARRLKEYPCGLDLIQNSKMAPVSEQDGKLTRKRWYRFSGKNGNLKVFFIQIKENRKTGEKDLMSVFPAN
jgi:hypothetical protein